MSSLFKYVRFLIGLTERERERSRESFNSFPKWWKVLLCDNFGYVMFYIFTGLGVPHEHHRCCL